MGQSLQPSGHSLVSCFGVTQSPGDPESSSFWAAGQTCLSSGLCARLCSCWPLREATLLLPLLSPSRQQKSQPWPGHDQPMGCCSRGACRHGGGAGEHLGELRDSEVGVLLASCWPSPASLCSCPQLSTSAAGSPESRTLHGWVPVLSLESEPEGAVGADRAGCRAGPDRSMSRLGVPTRRVPLLGCAVSVTAHWLPWARPSLLANTGLPWAGLSWGHSPVRMTHRSTGTCLSRSVDDRLGPRSVPRAAEGTGAGDRWVLRSPPTASALAVALAASEPLFPLPSFPGRTPSPE